MDRLELAERRYQAILPRLPVDPAQLPRRELDAWLQTDVCPVITDYAKRPRFREQAAWPLEKLLAGADSNERGMIEAVDHGLVNCARALTKLADTGGIDVALRQCYPPEELHVEGSFTITDDQCERTTTKKEMVDTLAMERNQVRQVSERFWTDLVCKEDYFEPTRGWMLKSPDGSIQPGQFIAAFQPQLLPVGDLVARTMLRRVEILFNELAVFRGKCKRAASVAKRHAPARLTAADTAWNQLESAYRSLQSALVTDPAVSARESCVVLTQVYAAFHPQPDLDWLPLSNKLIRWGAEGLRTRLDHRRGLEAFERIAAALGDLRRLYVGQTSEQSAIEEAITSGGLVLVEEGREVYWNGTRINADWHRNDGSWRFLRALAKNASTSAPVGESDLFGDAVVATSTMSTAFGRLKKLLPAELRSRILPGVPPRTYRMELNQRVYLF